MCALNGGSRRPRGSRPPLNHAGCSLRRRSVSNTVASLSGTTRLHFFGAPDAAVLSVNITIHSPLSLNTELHSASGSQGLLVLLFPVSDDLSSSMRVC